MAKGRRTDEIRSYECRPTLRIFDSGLRILTFRRGGGVETAMMRDGAGVPAKGGGGGQLGYPDCGLRCAMYIPDSAIEKRAKSDGLRKDAHLDENGHFLMVTK